LACKEKTKNTNGAFVFGEKKKPVLPPKLEPALNIHSGLLPKLMIGLGNTFTRFNFVEARFGLPIQLK
jgi:hypothetical protein